MKHIIFALVLLSGFVLADEPNYEPIDWDKHVAAEANTWVNGTPPSGARYTASCKVAQVDHEGNEVFIFYHHKAEYLDYVAAMAATKEMAKIAPFIIDSISDAIVNDPNNELGTRIFMGRLLGVQAEVPTNK